MNQLRDFSVFSVVRAFQEVISVMQNGNQKWYFPFSNHIFIVVLQLNLNSIYLIVGGIWHKNFQKKLRISAEKVVCAKYLINLIRPKVLRPWESKYRNAFYSQSKLPINLNRLTIIELIFYF